MAAGDKIFASDYNNIRNKVIGVLGAGSGNTGYGQTVQSTAVAEGNSVTRDQWNLLRYDLYNALFHQTGSAPSLVSKNAGDLISFGAGEPNSQYNTSADTATTNRFTVGAGQYIQNLSVATRTKTDIWYTQAYCDVTVSFGSAAAARYFFNSGGQVRVTSSRSGGDVKAQNTKWSELLSGAGIQVFSGVYPAADFSAMDGRNFYRLTNSPQTYYTVTSSGPYAANRYSLQAWSNVANNSSGTATTMYIRALFQDPYTDPPVIGPSGPVAPSGPFPPADGVNGNLTVTVDEIKASGVLQPAPATGNFTIASPAFSISGFTAS